MPQHATGFFIDLRSLHNGQRQWKAWRHWQILWAVWNVKAIGENLAQGSVKLAKARKTLFLARVHLSSRIEVKKDHFVQYWGPGDWRSFTKIQFIEYSHFFGNMREFLWFWPSASRFPNLHRSCKPNCSRGAAWVARRATAGQAIDRNMRGTESIWVKGRDVRFWSHFKWAFLRWIQMMYDDGMYKLLMHVDAIFLLDLFGI